VFVPESIHRAGIFNRCGGGAVAAALKALQTTKTLHTVVLISKHMILWAVWITFQVSVKPAPEKREEKWYDN
jgi:hypothetical protein